MYKNIQILFIKNTYFSLQNIDLSIFDVNLIPKIAKFVGYPIFLLSCMESLSCFLFDGFILVF